VQDIDPLHPVLPGERAHAYLAAGSATREVIEGTAPGRVAIEVDRGRAVEAVRAQGDARQVGLLDEVLEGQALAAGVHPVVGELDLAGIAAEVLGGESHEPALDAVAGIEGRHAVHVRAGRRRRRRGVGDLVGPGGADENALVAHAERPRDHLRDLGVQPLPHLRAAVVQVDAAVGVDVHQRAGLVQVLRGEGDTELHRGERQAAAHVVPRRVEAGNSLAPGPVVAVIGEPAHEIRQHRFLDGLSVGRDIALGVEVVQAHVQRVAANAARDIVEHGLGGDQTLRAAEAAESGVRDLVGAAVEPADARGPEVVGIVRVKHGAVDNALGEVRRAAAVTGEHHGHTVQPPALVEARAVAVPEGVTLARLHHVVAPRQAVAHRAAGAHGEERGQAGRHRRLGLLAAEAPAHAPHFRLHGMDRQAEDTGHQLLHLARVLAGAVDMHPALLGGLGGGNLPFEVEVLLARHVQLPVEGQRRREQRGLRLAQAELVRRQHVVRALDRRGEIDDGFQGLAVDVRERHRLLCRLEAGRRHGKNGLAEVQHFPVGEQRVTVVDRGDVAVTGNVRGADHVDHARSFAHAGQVEVLQPPPGHGCPARGDMQLVRVGRHVVDVHGRARDMAPGRILRQTLADGIRRPLAQGRLRRLRGELTHAAAPRRRCRDRCRPSAPGAPGAAMPRPSRGGTRRWRVRRRWA